MFPLVFFRFVTIPRMLQGFLSASAKEVKIKTLYLNISAANCRRLLNVDFIDANSSFSLKTTKSLHILTRQTLRSCAPDKRGLARRRSFFCVYFAKLVC